MNDYQFGMELRRGLLQIAWALIKRYGCSWLYVILTGEQARKCGEAQPVEGK